MTILKMKKLKNNDPLKIFVWLVLSFAILYIIYLIIGTYIATHKIGGKSNEKDSIYIGD